jgi:Mn2+-dependent serine/threonine protein kinase
MAQHAGVRVPRVDRVIKAADGTALLAMERVEGSPLDRLPAERISDEVLQRLWAEVNRLHSAGIAHRACGPAT